MPLWKFLFTFALSFFFLLEERTCAVRGREGHSLLNGAGNFNGDIAAGSTLAASAPLPLPRSDSSSSLGHECKDTAAQHANGAVPACRCRVFLPSLV